MTDRLRPDDPEEGMVVRLARSLKGAPGSGNGAEGRVSRVWRPEDEVEQFTVETDDEFLNVYTDYRDPPVERVAEREGDEGPDAETVGRLDEITRLDGR